MTVPGPVGLRVRVRQAVRELAVRGVLDACARTPGFTFVEVGAGDGVANDLLRAYVLKHRWRGVFVEPVRYIFEKLVANYAGREDLAFENVAIAPEPGVREFYRVRRTSDPLPEWYDQLGSFDRDVVLKHREFIPDLEKYIVSEPVPCMTLPGLFEKHRLRRLDLLQVDVEGRDDEVLRAVPFGTLKPRMIRYENKHLGAQREAVCRASLRANGYVVIDQGDDTFAFVGEPALRLAAVGAVAAGLTRRLLRKGFARVRRPLVEAALAVENAFVEARDPLVPPRKLREYVGPFASAHAYRRAGEAFAAVLKRDCALRPDHAVLDVGCGCGMVAAPLTRLLSVDGRYEGFDLSRDAIRWCSDRITARYPRFRFSAADIANGLYNPAGPVPAATYRFPYGAEAFDVVFAKSVFTHLLPDAAENYMAEIARVLKPGGACLATFFLLNPASLESIAEGRSAFRFYPAGAVYRVRHPERPEDAVAYDEGYVRGLLEKNGLEERALRPGLWVRCQTSAPEFQDMLVFRKRFRADAEA